MKTTVMSLGLLCLLLVCSPAGGQNKDKPLTNADIIQMVKAGLAENVIILSVQGSPANYDTSPTALIELNKQGVTAKVQEAMLAAQKPAQAPPSVEPAVAGMGSLGRVFLLGGAEPTEMKQNKGEYDSFWTPFFVKVFIKFEGRQAEFRVTNASPVFELRLPGNWVAAEHVRLVKPTMEKTRRELIVQGMAGPGVPIRPDKKANMALAFEEVRKENTAGAQIAVYRAKPVSSLRPGEYVLSVDHAFFCFGVDMAR